MNIMKNTLNETLQSPVSDIVESVEQLSTDKQITRDQERIVTAVLQDPEQAMLINRLVNQGSDPESLRKVNPDAFKRIADTIGLSEEEAVKVIQKAHHLGPAVLEDGGRDEILWLLIASISADESAKRNLADRLVQFGQAIERMNQMADKTDEDLRAQALNYKTEILEKIKPISHTPNGVPIYNKDLGFFAAYRSGIQAAIVQANDGYDAVGTTPDTTLAEQGLSIEKEISPHFGLNFTNITERKNK